MWMITKNKAWVTSKAVEKIWRNEKGKLLVRLFSGEVEELEERKEFDLGNKIIQVEGRT